MLNHFQYLIKSDDQVKKANIDVAVTKLDKDPIEVVWKIEHVLK